MQSSTMPTRYVALCSAGTCADIVKVDGGVSLTSTVSPDRGRLFLDDGEFVQLVKDVKAGHVDTLYAEASQHLTAVLA
jgi:hypothetical protein